MKKFILYVVGALLVMALASCNKKEQENTVWKFGHLSNEQHLWHKAAEKFAALVEEKTEGSLTIELFPNEQLGSEIETINDIKTGTADMTITGESLSNWAPKAAVLGLPYVIKSREHLNAVLSGSIGEEITREISQKVGLKVLYHHKRAPRNLTSNKPVQSPKDVKGLKMRVPSVPAFMNAWSAVGANPQVMAFSEVFTALQQNVIEAQENPYDLIVSASFFEVQKYVNETEHVFGWIYVVVGEAQFEKLNEEQQRAVLEAATEVEAWADDKLASETENAKQVLLEKGMVIVSEVDKNAFAEQMIPAVTENLEHDVAEVVTKIVALDD